MESVKLKLCARILTVLYPVCSVSVQHSELYRICVVHLLYHRFTKLLKCFTILKAHAHDFSYQCSVFVPPLIGCADFYFPAFLSLRSVFSLQVYIYPICLFEQDRHLLFALDRIPIIISHQCCFFRLQLFSELLCDFPCCLM